MNTTGARVNIMRLALGQFTPPSCDVAGSLARIMDMCQQAAAAGASWLILPELALGGYQIERARDIALDVDGPELTALTREARRLTISVQVGFAERQGALVYNSVLLMGQDGTRRIYRKTHLFGREPQAFTPGSALAIASQPALRLAPLICYDIEFPELARSLAQHGADAIFVSTANMEPYGDDQPMFARARALENGLFVAIANRTGSDEGFQFFGGSVVADPFGRILAQAGNEETLLLADCDLGLVAEARAANHYLTDRRPDLPVEMG
ncbi:MAG TPA: carbon-nitrogen hydrolase family protein [Ktedonobacterales bacterium]